MFGAVSVLLLGAYEDAFIDEHACGFLRKLSDESPWHYFTSFVSPHNPWDVPRENFDVYRNAEMPKAIKDPGKKEPFQREDLLTTMRHYAGMITLIDDYIGKMFHILKERGMFENTVIMCCTNHGEMMGDHGRFEKDVFYEASVRIPLIISGAGVKARGVSDVLVVERVN